METESPSKEFWSTSMAIIRGSMQMFGTGGVCCAESNLKKPRGAAAQWVLLEGSGDRWLCNLAIIR